MFDDLYNADILGLSATLENAALVSPDGTARKVSKLCGSWLEIDLKIEDGVVTGCAMRVQACALGQASAAILKASIIGANLEELIAARDGLRAMLRDGGDPPAGRFAKLSLLAGVAAYPARHTSTLLAFEAAVLAFEAAVFAFEA
jgi:NifU-like protein involved in Fe-S cluster formation